MALVALDRLVLGSALLGCLRHDLPPFDALDTSLSGPPPIRNSARALAQAGSRAPGRGAGRSARGPTPPGRAWLSRSLRVTRQDVELADDTAVLELEDRVRQNPASARELARDRRGSAIPVGDGVLDRCHDARAGA